MKTSFNYLCIINRKNVRKTNLSSIINSCTFCLGKSEEIKCGGKN